MWQKFTELARRVVFFAQEEAGRRGHEHVGTEHLLLGLLRVREGHGVRVLETLGIDLSHVRHETERQATRGDGRTGGDMQLAPGAKRVIDLAYAESRGLRNQFIGTEHLLLGLMRGEAGLAGRILREMGVEIDSVRREAAALQASSAEDRLVARLEQLPADQRDALAGQGLPFAQLDPETQKVVQDAFLSKTSFDGAIEWAEARIRVERNQTRTAAFCKLIVEGAFSALLSSADEE